jgi:hypothetical protein
MASYKVISNRVVGKKAGDAITDEELAGANIEALIEAGHLAPVNTKKKNDEPKVEV